MDGDDSEGKAHTLDGSVGDLVGHFEGVGSEEAGEKSGVPLLARGSNSGVCYPALPRHASAALFF